MGGGPADAQADVRGHVPHPAKVVDVRLSPAGNGRHGLHRLHGVLAGSGLAGEHDGGGAVVDGVGHVGDLGPGGPGVGDHAVQHLGGGDHVLSVPQGIGNDVLLNDGNLGEVDLHPHVPRAIITPSATARISSTLFAPSWFSSLAMIRMSEWCSSSRRRISITSWAGWGFVSPKEPRLILSQPHSSFTAPEARARSRAKAASSSGPHSHSSFRWFFSARAQRPLWA